jgi:hypothetical protein
MIYCDYDKQISVGKRILYEFSTADIIPLPFQI